MLSGALPFGDLIQEAEISGFNARSCFKRKRIFTPDVTLKAFLSQVVGRTGSCQEAVSAVSHSTINARGESCSLNTSSYSRARTKLKSDAVECLTKQIHESAHEIIDRSWLWKKRNVFILDGSTLAMADTDQNIALYPKRKNHIDDRGYPLARVMLLSSLATGTIVDFNLGAFKGKGTGEIPLAAKIIKELPQNDVIVADAMFISYSFIGLCVNQQLDFLAPKKSNRKFTIISEKRIGEGDRLIRIRKPRLPHTGWISEEEYAEIDNVLTLRETQITITSNGFIPKKVKVLSTFLDTKRYTKLDLAELLLNRWNIELDLRIVKRELSMNFLRCKSPDMVIKEIWANLLAFNLIRRFICFVSRQIKTIPRRVSFSKTLDYYLKTFQQQSFKIKRLSSAIKSAISQFVLQMPKYRFEPRARKTSYGQNDYPTLTVSRKRWKAIQIAPLLEREGLELSSALTEGLEKAKKQIPIKSGKVSY